MTDEKDKMLYDQLYEKLGTELATEILNYSKEQWKYFGGNVFKILVFILRTCTANLEVFKDDLVSGCKDCEKEPLEIVDKAIKDLDKCAHLFKHAYTVSRIHHIMHPQDSNTKH